MKADRSATSSGQAGFRAALPMLPPLIAFGLVYGALAAQVGLSPLVAGLSSVLIVSGSAQLAMVGLIPFGPGPVLLATTGLALRHVPMAIHLSELLGPLSGWQRFRLAWILVDESYGLTIGASEKGVSDLAAYKSAADLTLYFSWITTTVLGAVFGAQLDPGRLGLDAVIPLVFLGLAAAIIRGWRHWTTVGLALAATVGAVVWLPTAWQVTAAAAVAAGLATIIPGQDGGSDD